MFIQPNKQAGIPLYSQITEQLKETFLFFFHKYLPCASLLRTQPYGRCLSHLKKPSLRQTRGFPYTKKHLPKQMLSSHYFILPSPPMSAVISSIRSNGKGGSHKGFMAIDINFIGLSSAATRFEDNSPHLRQRWIMAHSPFFLTHTATGSMIPPQSDARSPGSMST